MNATEREIWPRIKAAIYATTISRVAVLEQWPECHKTRCTHRHGTPDEAFRMFADQIAETVWTELLCKAVSEPCDDLEETS